MTRRMPAAADIVVVGTLAIVGILNVIPGLGLFGPDRLATLYGTAALDSNLSILLRHRALLLALLGALLLASIWLKPLRVPILVAAIVSKVVFVWLVVAEPHTPEIGRVALLDAVALPFLVAALWVCTAQGRRKAPAERGKPAGDEVTR